MEHLLLHIEVGVTLHDLSCQEKKGKQNKKDLYCLFFFIHLQDNINKNEDQRKVYSDLYHNIKIINKKLDSKVNISIS